MHKKVHFTTLGCKVNQYDSQAMLEQFEQHGYTAAASNEMADVYVVNTCTVTGTGDKTGSFFHKLTLRVFKGDAIGLLNHNSQSSFSSCQPST